MIFFSRQAMPVKVMLLSYPLAFALLWQNAEVRGEIS